MVWFRRTNREERPASRVPEGLWVKCEGCREILYRKELERSLFVCPRCGHHHRISARTRLAQLFDNGEWKELFGNVYSTDPLEFVDSKPYGERLKALKEKGLRHDAMLIGLGKMGGRRVIIGAMEYAFMGGSMGSAMGEKLTRAIERCLKTRTPLITVSCSGGARMQEGVLSLMQLGKICTALAKLHQARVPFISVLTDPTTGGVTASFAMLGDINIGEPGALIGFAGPRVIEQTIRQKLPEGFQRAEFLLEHGMLDRVVPRGELKETLVKCLALLSD
ncbi:MAG: acetyl-CoA carboxylase, carboxyltransferase subunit beta [Thermoanaerobaculum sp.]|nr:acetyl-CoA carboxylase, carboxyltransferase subunit beta [Thermoanaerobaculum sp.]MDW7966866.1 acetyl-CoA carboxylase, carboxyltransferase subunit beta [Thermoanaerobaculum sp.]